LLADDSRASASHRFGNKKGHREVPFFMSWGLFCMPFGCMASENIPLTKMAKPSFAILLR